MIADKATLEQSGMDKDTPVITREQAQAIFDARQPAFEVVVTQMVANATYSAIYGTAVFRIRPCAQWIHGIFGAEVRLPGHIPAYFGNSGCLGIECFCNVTAPPAVWIGFDHAKVNTRNLSRIFVGKPDEDTTEHCLGLLWKKDGKLNLFDLLHWGYSDYKDDLYFTSSNLKIKNDALIFAGRPGDMTPSISLVKLHYRPDNGKVFDKIWVVINAPVTKTKFDKWYKDNDDIGWTTNLPPVFPSITFTTNWLNFVRPTVTNLAGSGWRAPTRKNTYLHHDAKYEMRSERVGKHYGHQAMYDADGALIETTIAAGTADIYTPDNLRNVRRHRKEDVHPFIRALQLDGNPVAPDSTPVPTTLTRPCIYEGTNTVKYLEKRPPLPTGKRK